MTQRLCRLFVTAVAFFLSPLACDGALAVDAQSGAQSVYRDSELLVKFRGDSGALAANIHAATGGRRVARFGRIELVRLAAGKDVEGMRRWYESRSEVEYAEPNYIVRMAALPNDTNFSRQWGLRNRGQIILGAAGTVGADINAAAAWDRHTGAGSVLVALLDTGIDYNHPDLAANVWRNPAEIAGNGIDDDGNGNVDDIRGWDFFNNDADPMDDCVDGHGSHVAGIIGAVGNNAAGVSGVNWRVQLMPLKVLCADGFGSVANVIAAMDYAIAKGVSIINASYSMGCGAEPSQSERDYLNRARAAGILVVLAAGNEDCDNDVRPTYPASHALNNLIAVAASDPYDQRALYSASVASSYGGQSVHLFAPGKNVYSTLRLVLGGGYGYMSGTSMAAPHVSGAAALLKSYRPALNMFQVREILLKTAAARPALAGLAVTGGRLDLGTAMDFDLATGTPLQPSHLVASKVDDSRIDLTWIDDSTIETGWKLQYHADPGTDFVTLSTLAAATLNYQDNAARVGEGTYNGYRVLAFNGIGDSSPGPEVKLITPPLAPDNLRISGQGDSRILTWIDRSARESGYRVERAVTTGGLFREIASLPANTTQYRDTNLLAGSEYSYRVRAASVVAGFSAYTGELAAASSGGDSGGGGGCFIATAAYGSALHPKVRVLRQFRDHYLMPNVFGRALVNAYYRASPPLADLIARHDWLRAGVRTLLWPLVWLAESMPPEARTDFPVH